MQSILHAGIECVYFAFNSITNYWRVEDGRDIRKKKRVKKNKRLCLYLCFLYLLVIWMNLVMIVERPD